MTGWSKSDVTRLRELMRAQGRDIDEIADEVRAMCGTSRLAAYRMAHGLSQPQVVERFLGATDGAFLDQPTLSRLEQFPARGSRAPLAIHLVTLATIYGTTPLRLVTSQALEQLDAREREVLLRCQQLPAPESGRAVDAGEASVLVPALAAGGGGVNSLEGQVAMAARRAFKFAAAVEGTNVGPETLTEVQDEARRIAAAYPQQPLAALLGDLVYLQDVVFRLLEGRQRPLQARDLHTVAGITSGMLAKASHDLGDPQAAMTQARTAFICAENAEHDGLRTWVRGLQSLVAYWAGWPHEALRYARLGAEPAERTSGSASVWIASLEARAWAMFGNDEGTLSALSRADGLRESAQPDELDDVGGILTFSQPKQEYYGADALALLPKQARAAESRALDAIEAFDDAPAEARSFGDEAGARTDVAVARARLGDPEGAGEALGSVLELPVAQRINGIVASVQRVHVALNEPASAGSAVALSMQEEIEAFSRATASALAR